MQVKSHQLHLFALHQAELMLLFSLSALFDASPNQLFACCLWATTDVFCNLSILFSRVLMLFFANSLDCLLLYCPLYFFCSTLPHCPLLSIYSYCDLIPLSRSLCSTTAAPSITHMQAHTHQAIQSSSSEDKDGSVIDTQEEVCQLHICMHGHTHYAVSL